MDLIVDGTKESAPIVKCQKLFQKFTVQVINLSLMFMLCSHI